MMEERELSLMSFFSCDELYSCDKLLLLSSGIFKKVMLLVWGLLLLKEKDSWRVS